MTGFSYISLPFQDSWTLYNIVLQFFLAVGFFFHPCSWCKVYSSSVSVILLAVAFVYAHCKAYFQLSSSSVTRTVSGGHSSKWTNPLKAFLALAPISVAAFDFLRVGLGLVKRIVSILWTCAVFRNTPAHSWAQAHLEATQCSQCDLLAIERFHWRRWGSRVLLKGSTM